MKFKEFIDKIRKLKQENPEVASCINDVYYLKSFYDKNDIFKPALYFDFSNENYQIYSVYDLSDYMDKEVKEIKYDNHYGDNVIYIDVLALQEKIIKS